jgi:Mce-associated membrane protein
MSADADVRVGTDGRRTRARVRRPAGPPGGEPATATTVVPSTPVTSTPSASPVDGRPVRRSAPISSLRRGRSDDHGVEKSTDAQGSTEAGDGAAPAPPVSVSLTKAAPARSGATLSYRERRRGTTAVPKKAPVRRSRLGVWLAGTLAVLVIAALAAVSVFFAVGTARIDERAAQRAEYVAFARQMVVNLTSLSPTTVDNTLAEFRRDASGKALEETSQTLQQTIDLIKTQNVTTTGTILADAVVSSDAEQATVLIVSGWTMNNPQPVVQTFRWKVTVSRIDGQLKLTGYEWVT